MCGISGIIYFDKREPSIEELLPMMGVMQHRGPDESGMWTNPGVGFGFQRLSIVDVKNGHQPMSNEDGTVWIVFNGEIYNYPELRSMLSDKGHQFKSESDTEVIVHLYEEYGSELVRYLRGMFAFVIWDTKLSKAFGARDHFGIKPLYYTVDHEKLIFASEIKSILAWPGWNQERKLHLPALLQYMSFQYVPDPLTMFEGVKKLPPASSFTAGWHDLFQLRKYWTPSFEPVSRSMDEVVEQIRGSLSESVGRHMQGEVKRGCFLSSGIDSTAIAALMRKREEIKTFSIGFEGPNNETVFAERTAVELGTEHHALTLSERDYFSSVQRAVWHQDEPVADPSAIALYNLAKLASEHVTVVLSGEGADELFGGYRIYREPGSLRPFDWMPDRLKNWLHRLLTRMIPEGVTGRNYLLRGTTPLERRFIGNARIFQPEVLEQLLRQDVLIDKSLIDPYSVTKDYYRQSANLDPVTRMQLIDMNFWLTGDILMKADKMSMAHSLELRVPFLDIELFETARQIPASHRIMEGTTKFALRKAMEGVVPEFIRHRPKLGFPVPIRDWLKGASGDELWERVQGSPVSDYFRMDLIGDMLHKHRQGQGDYSRKLWLFYVLSLWHQSYLQVN